ncbi:MAG: carotenoid biosynthesis protein [Angustibacter sp.]
MSVHVPAPSAAQRPEPRPSRRSRRARIPAVLAGLTILTQVCYPLTTGQTLQALTIGAVLLFAAASISHASVHRGTTWAGGLLLIAGGIGLAAEAVGVRTGIPFGSYRYTGNLGPQLLDVPVVVPLAWTMMAYPCLLLGRGLAGYASGRVPAVGSGAGTRRRTLITIAAGGAALASWDLFLDPQMVAAGNWRFDDPTPALPGVPGIPLTNYAGWLVVALLMITVLHIALPDRRVDVDTAGADDPGDGVPLVLLTWTWLGSTIGNAVFFDRPAVAAWGGLLMGSLVVPWVICSSRRTPAADAIQVIPVQGGRH